MKVAWLFPGQGAQVVGMGKDVALASPAAAQVFARVDEALGSWIGRPLSSLCFEGPEADLMLTAHTQPAIVATSMAILAALRERWPTLKDPCCAAGHSLGEYSALVAAGALDVVDACKVVHLRGKAMQSAVPPGEGAMSALMGIEPQAVVEVCAEAAQATGLVVSPANFNAPGQIVIAGAGRAVARAVELASLRKAKAIPLKVSAPFHCALMSPAADVVREALTRTPLHAARFPVLANVDTLPRTAPDEIREALVSQVASPVRWQSTIEAMVASGVTHVVEIGPGKVLQGLAKKISKSLAVISVPDVASFDALEAFLSS